MGPARACAAGSPYRLEIVLRIRFPAAVLAALLPCVSAAEAADLAAPVPRTAYRSAFDGLPRGVEEGSVPWKDANAAVAEFPRGHIDLLKWEERQQGAAPTAPAGAAPAPAPAPQPAAPRRYLH